MVLALLEVVFPVLALADAGPSNKGKALCLEHYIVCHSPDGKGDGYTHFNAPVADLTASTIQKVTEKV